jgi:hypothetical protein
MAQFHDATSAITTEIFMVFFEEEKSMYIQDKKERWVWIFWLNRKEKECICGLCRA